MPTLRSLIDCFRWVDDCLGRIAPKAGLSDADAWERLAEVIPHASLSTCFSGIGAPEQAATSIAAAVSGHLRERSPGHIRSLYAVEWCQEQRRELQSMAHPPDHMYLDVNAFWSRDALGHEPWDMTFQQLETSLSLHASRCIRTAAHCIRHGKACQSCSASIHIGGSPCTDWSPQGSRQKECGKTLACTMAWIGQRLVLEDCVWFNENVPAFQAIRMLALLKKKYLIESVVLDAFALGWPQRRLRRITIGIRKDLIRVPHIPWPSVATACGRTLEIDWTALMVAPDKEAEEELEWARHRSSSLYRQDVSAVLQATREKNTGRIMAMIGKSDNFAKEHGHVLIEELEALRSKSSFTAALSLTELVNLHGYVNKFPGRRAYMLGQMWDAWPIYGTEEYLPTLIRNMGLVFSPVAWRWLTPREALLAQGFPAYKPLQPYGHCGESSSFDASRTSLVLPPRRRSALFEQCGNAMNTNMIGIGVLYTLLMVDLPATPTPTEAAGSDEPAPSRKRHFFRIAQDTLKF